MKTNFSVVNGEVKQIVSIDGKVVAEGPVDAQALEAMSMQIAAARSQIRPEVPKNFPIGREMQAIVDPRWYTELNLLTGLTSLCIRHPGLGWLAFLIPGAGTKLMSDLFSKQEEARKAGLATPTVARN